MSYRYLQIVACIFLLIPNSQGQSPFDEVKFDGEKLLRQRALVLDSLQFDINNSHVKNLNTQCNIDELAQFLEENKALNANIYVLMNTNYDTISSHFLKTRSDNLIRSLIYFNVDPERVQVKDSVVKSYDRQYTREEAFRKIEVHLGQDNNYFSTLENLNGAFLNGEVPMLFQKWSSSFHSKQQQLNLPNNLIQFEVDDLIKQFYSTVYKNKRYSKYLVLPQVYSVRIGTVFKSTTPEHYFEEMDLSIAGSVDVTSMANSHYRVAYIPALDDENIIYLTEERRRALKEFLDFDFSYDLDSMTNSPSNIKPQRETLSRLQAVKKLIDPRHEYLVRGFCHSHMFWDFHWQFSSPYVLDLISIDEASKNAFLDFKNENMELRTAVFLRRQGEWVFKEIIDYKCKPSILSWKLILYLSLAIPIFCWMIFATWRKPRTH